MMESAKRRPHLLHGSGVAGGDQMFGAVHLQTPFGKGERARKKLWLAVDGPLLSAAQGADRCLGRDLFAATGTLTRIGLVIVDVCLTCFHQSDSNTCCLQACSRSTVKKQ